MSTSPHLYECANCLCMASRQAARAITSIFDRRLRPYELRATQFTILVNLSLRGPTMLGELAKQLLLERTSLIRNLALMEKHGWVEIQSDVEDGRARIASVATLGQTLIERAYPAWRAAQDEVAQIVGARGSAALHELANAMTD